MASAYDARGPPGGPPPHYSNGRGGPPPPHAGYGGSGRSSSFERPRGGGGGERGGGGPVNFSSSYEVPPSPIATGGTPPPMSISADESDEGGRSGQRDAYGRAAAAEAEAYHRAQARGREYARHDGRGDPRDYGGHPPPHRDGRGRAYEYDRDRRARSHSRSHAPQPHPEDRAPPGGSIFRGPYEDHPGGYSAAAAAAAHEEAERRRQYEHERAAYEQGYDPRDPRVDPRGDPRARSHHPPPPPDHYRAHHHSAPPPPGHQHHHHQGWGHPGGRTETPPPRTSSLPRMADGHHPLPAAVSPPDRAGARSGDSVASSDHGGSIHGHPPSAMTTPVNAKDREYMGGVGSGRPPTGKPPSSVMAAAAASAAGINPAAGVIVSPPPLPHEARLAGHRRMPCRARSVPVGHTPQTAYLSIPPDAPHGMVLVCSHPECAASGKRFRFCAVCDIPVAKRNFLKRHSHGLVSPGSPAAQVGQPGAITGKEAVEMARSLGTVSPSTGNASGAGGTPASPGSQTASGGEGTGEDNSDEEEDAEEQAAADAEDAATEKDAQDAKKKAQETKDSKDKSDSKDVTLCRPCPARAPSLGDAGGGASMPMSPGCLSTGSIRPRSDSDDSNRSAFGSPVKRQRDGGSTPPKDRLRPPDSIDLTLPRMPGDDGPHQGADDRDAKVKVTPVSDEGGKPRGRSVSGLPKIPPSRDMSPAAFSSASGRRGTERGESPRPMSPPALRTCRTFPLPPPHRDPRFAAANAEAEGEGEAHHQDSQEAYYYRRSPAPWGGPGAHHHSASASASHSPHRDYYHQSDECPPTPSRIMVAGVSAHSRPGAALSFDHERHRRSLADSALSESCRSDNNQCLSDNEDVGLNAHSFHGGGDGRRSSSASSLTYRRSNTGGDAPVHRFRARLRAREHSSARSTGRLAFGRSSSRLSSSGRSASSASGMGLTSPRASPTSGTEGHDPSNKSNNDFEPPTPHASVVRLSRRERQWLELLRNKPSMGDVDNLEEWMDRVLDISDETAPPTDEEGEDSRGNSMEEDGGEDNGRMDQDANADAADGSSEQRPRALNEVVRPTRPRPIWPESDSDPPSDDGTDPAQDNRMRTDRDDDDADNAGVNRHRLRPPHLPLSRTETPLHENSSKAGGDCLMDARAEAKRNLQVRAAAVASTRGGSSGILDRERERAESRTDIDAEDHSLSEEGGVHGNNSDKTGGRRGSVASSRTMSRDIPTPPPMCFADGARSGLAGLFGCGAFLCAETGQVSGMEPSSHQEGAGSFLLEGGRGGPCAPCGGNAVDDGSAGRSFRAGVGGAGTPVQLDMPAPIELNKRVDSNVSAASSVSMTGSSMVDMLEGTGLMPGTPGGQYSFHHHSHSHPPTHTPRNSDGEFRYLDGINLDSPFPPAPSPRGRMSTGSVSNMDEDRDMKAAAAEAEEEEEKAKVEGGGDDKNEAGEKMEEDDEGGETKRTGLLASPPRGKHHIQKKKTLPSLPSLKSDPAKGGGAGAMEEFRVGDVSISMKKSVDEDNDAKGGRGCDDHEEVETELKVEEEEEDKEEGGGKETKVKQEGDEVKSC